ncbi:dihydroxyacetone kinase DhaM subunit [Hydrogenoanaerobacterium saccharovorans]|uniref:phosphoenolpyruvate--glycerone phosphotransferase n=1 Tax=Hydrogenoanaerobacterium saccharovorans TaxID=474960 RepID=A0A1H7YN60_9FIRM|nr:dihydroxyacetone kinase phosphoryl donor subunit DhaM [Hydrogenoanaerobacterium saccharovorans]RPF49152.1 dihydroxyacetone kinase DhaM subunit [Hydrogenoanaerobacterium saccharovorans]SEM46747.1 dihydroxyacetone kinase DhaM subunit [Hydrogenoanaerobacterium saccharovorans]
MVGLVIVSHSEKLAQGVVELAHEMAKDAPIAAAGGMPDGSLGTCFERVYRAIESVYSEDGVLVLVDMGSAVMTAEMAIERHGGNIRIADSPLVEGAILAAIQSSIGCPIAQVELAAILSKSEDKL